MFLHLSVSHSVHRGGCLGDMTPVKHSPGQTPPWADTLPQADTPWADTPHQVRQSPPGRRLLQRTVRILLECILVLMICLFLLYDTTNLGPIHIERE